MSTRRTCGLFAVSFAALVAGSLGGCREIVGVPAGSSLADIERPPPICECGPLELQPGGDVVRGCIDAYASLPDFGEGDAAAPFGSKEAFLASDCAVCRQNDPDGLRVCYAQLLESAEPGVVPPVGSNDAACDSPGDCGSWACCADVDAGRCCGSCVGCSAHVASEGLSPLCVEDAEVLSALGECLCDFLTTPPVPLNVCNDECERGDDFLAKRCAPNSAVCVNCMLGFASVGDPRCEAESLACQSSAVERPVGSGG